MTAAKWKESFVALVACAGLTWGQTDSSQTPPLGIGRDLLTVREPGRADQKCRILKAWKQPDGTLAFEVQCLETEERLTLVEMASAETTFKDSPRAMRSRIFHWGQNLTPPPGVPRMPTTPVAMPEKGIDVKSESAPVTGTSNLPTVPPVASSGDGPKEIEIKKSEPLYPLPPEAKLGPIQVETAKPSNWQESWGKADDHHTKLTDEKVTETSPVNSESGHDPVKAPSALPVPTSAPVNPPTTSVDQVSSEVSPENSGNTEKAQNSLKVVQPAGYTHIDDRPGVAHVTDIPPTETKAAPGSKTPVMDFFRTLWKPPLKEPAPLQSIQVAEAPAPMPAPSPLQFQAVLQDSLLPSEREMAADALSGFQRLEDPTIVPALLRAATEDPAATVRASCVHGLAKMNANTSDVVSALMNLKADPDVCVRREVNQALIRFGLAKPEPENEMIHQINAPGGKTGEW
jgi:hypothetical protein